MIKIALRAELEVLRLGIRYNKGKLTNIWYRSIEGWVIDAGYCYENENDETTFRFESIIYKTETIVAYSDIVNIEVSI